VIIDKPANSGNPVYVGYVVQAPCKWNIGALCMFFLCNILAV